MTVGDLLSLTPEELDAVAQPKNLHELRLGLARVKEIEAKIRDVITQAEQRQACPARAQAAE